MNNLLNKYEALESALRYIDLDPNAVAAHTMKLSCAATGWSMIASSAA